MILAQLFNNLGTSLFNIVFLMIAASRPHAKLAVTVVAFTTFLPNLFAILLGNLADKTHNHLRAWSITRLTQATIFLGIASLLFAYEKQTVTFIMLLFLIFINDILGLYSSLLMDPITRYILAQKDMQTAMSLEQAVSITMTMIGGFFGAGLFSLLNNNAATFSLINALFFIVAWLVMTAHQQYFIKPQQQISQHLANRSRNTLFSDFNATFTLVYRDRLFFQLIVLAAAVNFVSTSLAGLFNLTLLQIHQLLIGNFGTTVAVFGAVETVSMLLGSIVIHDIFQHLTTKQLIGTACGLLLLLGLVPSIWPNRLVWLCLISGIGYVSAKINPRLGAIMMQRVAPDRLASVGGLINTLVLATAPLGQLLFLSLANIITPSFAWLTMSALLFIIVSYTIYTRHCDLERVEN
ncbi:MFS transporter [Leuconostoc holzapfelii]|uniref:MFS transporter n=2 Tax=Leuconostoc holzapfelii TaxID=434464 RepID=A0ABT2NXW4_9LACO|nr:MFS transporter [Leuconostoc holzapfelii]